MKDYIAPSEEIFYIDAEEFVTNSFDYENEHYGQHDRETEVDALTNKKNDYPWNGGIWDTMNEE